MGDLEYDISELVDTAAQAYWEDSPQRAMSGLDWDQLSSVVKLNVREQVLPIVTAVVEALAAKKMFQNLEVIHDAVQVPDEECGDYPAPCNCDDSFTHGGKA